MSTLPGHINSTLSTVFFFSGLAGLIYQVTWQRLLTIHYGVGAVSIALIVSVYMLGLGLGSLLGGRLAERSSNLYTLCAGVEGMLGLAGLMSFPLLLSIGRYAADVSPAASFTCLFLFLSVPTLLMGMTLPLLATILTRMQCDFIYSVSRLCFVNALGASAGAVFTSYVLVSFLGLNGCIYLAAGINFTLAGLILRLRRKALREAPEYQSRDRLPEPRPALERMAYLLALVTGFIAIAYEIVWYRVIGVLVKDSPYAFSSILAIYLLALAVGSLAIQSYLARRPEVSRKDLFYTIQFLIGLIVLSIFMSYHYLTRYSPVGLLTRLSFSVDLHPSLNIFTAGRPLHLLEDIYLLVDVFWWPLIFVFGPAALMGASFPLIASLALSRQGTEGRAVGTTYFFGVLGNVLGGLLTGLVLLPAAGTETTVLALSSAGLLFGLMPGSKGRAAWPGLPRTAAVAVPLLIAIIFFPRPGMLFETMHTAPFAPARTHIREGLDAVVVTYEDGDRLRNFINGQGHGYRPGPAFLAEALEGLSFTPSPRRVLVIGFGAGSIAEAALIPAEAVEITVVELCESVIDNLRTVPQLGRLLGDRRIRVVIADGRHFLQKTGERFDAILMDPLRTTTAYSNNLHSRQFFELAEKHLTAGGVLMVGGLIDCPVIPRTVMEVFKHVRAYPNFCLASQNPLLQNHQRLETMLGLFPPETREAIGDFTRHSLEGSDLMEATRRYPANEDWRPVSEYYLGLQIRRWLGIYSER